MRNLKQDLNNPIKFFLSLLISFIAGSIFLCMCSSVQKIYIGAPLLLKGYVTPFFFGGFSAMLLWIWHRKYKLVAIDLKQLNVELENIVAERASELKKNVYHLKESEQFFQSALDGLSSCIAIIDEKGKIVQTNKSWQDFANNNGTASESVSEGVNYIQVCEHATGDESEEAKSFAEGIKLVLRGEKLTFSLEYPCHAPDIKRWFIGEVTRFPNDKVKNAIISHTDISKRKQAEEAIKTERRRLADVLEGTNAGNWEWNIQTGKTIFNERWAEIIGYTLEEISPVSIETWTKFCHPDDLKVSNELLEKHFNGELEYYDCETRMRHKNGNWIWVQDRGKVSIWTDDGKPLLLSGTHQEINKRKQAEKQIKASLKEKETLLQEIHHRVKNNMMVISSLLKLQMNNMDDKIAREALQDSQNRVQSMAMVHETLYRSDTLSAIDLKSYLTELGKNIVQNYSIGNKVQFKVEAENIMVSVRQASPVGLIVNELMANSLKYAFTDDRDGEILLELKLNKEYRIELSLSDNGIGIPEEFDLETAGSLGLKLVKMLIENQLDGSIDMESNNGTKFTIKFNIET
jgi:PAS domain S-box-containing protein